MSTPSAESLPPVAPVSRWGWVAASLVATALLAWSFQRADFAAVAAQLAGVRPAWLLLAMASYAGTIVLWTGLWRSWASAIRPVSWGEMGTVTVLLLLGANTLPFFGGHAIGVALLVRRAGLPLAGALSVLAVDQLIEGLAKVACLLAAAGVAPVAPWLAGALSVIGVAVLLALVAMLGAAWFLPGEVVARRFGAPGRFVQAWAGHLGVLRDGRRFALGVMAALAIKAGEAGALFCVQQALGADLPLASLPLVLCATQVAGMLPVSPGNLGLYEAAAMVVYTGLGVPEATALGLALLQHAAYLAVVILPGLGLLGWRSVRREPEGGP